MKQVFTNKPNILLQIMSKVLFELDKEKRYQIIIEEESKKRSLSSNGYAWVLMEKIAKVLNISKDEVYETMLNSYGTLYVEDNEIITIPTSKKLKSKPSLHLKYIGKKEVNKNVLNIYAVIKGSSEYNTEEMAKFIDGVVSEAQALDIETMTPDELANMQSLEEKSKNE